jgi:hypothetical protein
MMMVATPLTDKAAVGPVVYVGHNARGAPALESGMTKQQKLDPREAKPALLDHQRDHSRTSFATTSPARKKHQVRRYREARLAELSGPGASPQEKTRRNVDFTPGSSGRSLSTRLGGSRLLQNAA